ncbi:MAG TPA: hypothetical protein VGM54_22855 [Chthoniobacter sp.]|jgi:hypothetical protein
MKANDFFPRYGSHRGLAALFRNTLFLGLGLVAAIVCQADTAPPTPANGVSQPDFSAAEFPGVVWKNRLADQSLWNGRWQLEGSILKVPGDQAFIAFPETLTDSAIRVRFRFDGPGGSFIDLIVRSDGGANGDRYVATTFIGKDSDHKVTMNCRFKNGDDHGGLGGAGSLGTLKPGDEHTLALYVQGNHLAYYFDGRPAGSFHNSKRTEGRMCLFTGGQLHYLSVETAELGKGPAIAATTPAAASRSAAPGIATTTPPVAIPPPQTSLTPINRLPPGFTAPATAPAPAAPTVASGAHMMTQAVGGQSGKSFSETQPEGGILIGLDVWKGTYYRSLIIGGIRGIYETNKGRVRGQIFGQGSGDPDLTMMARDGSGIIRVEAMDDKQQVVAFRVGFANGEFSQWIGRDIDKNVPLNRLPRGIESKHLDTHKPAIGIFGGADGTLYHFGLIY